MAGIPTYILLDGQNTMEIGYMAYEAFNQNVKVNGWIGDWIVLVLLVSSGHPLDCYNY